MRVEEIQESREKKTLKYFETLFEHFKSFKFIFKKFDHFFQRARTINNVFKIKQIEKITSKKLTFLTFSKHN